jgi:low affinity Fe/Cu permease
MHANTGRANAPGWGERLTQRVTRWVSSVYGFVLTGLAVVGWTVAGLVHGFSDTWLLIINTAGTVTTLLMVFLIQRAQNKDTLALQLKLNEIVAALEGASNRLIDVESLSEGEVRRLHSRYQGLAKKATRGHAVTAAHTVEDHHEAAESGEIGHDS